MDAFRGFLLIEVLVALLVLAIGVLGILALQLHTLRATRESTLQSSALRLAMDIAEQVGGSADAPDLLQTFAQFDYVAADTTTTAGSACYGTGSSCTSGQMAAFAMRQWQQRLRETLPGGRVRICRDAAPWQAARKSMRWDCDGGSSALVPLWVKVGWPASPGSPASATPPAAPQLVLPVAVFVR